MHNKANCAPSTMLAEPVIGPRDFARVRWLAWSPSPAPFHCAGADKQIRSRGAFFAPEFLLTTNNQATKQIGAER